MLKRPTRARVPRPAGAGMGGAPGSTIVSLMIVSSRSVVVEHLLENVERPRGRIDGHLQNIGHVLLPPLVHVARVKAPQRLLPVVHLTVGEELRAVAEDAVVVHPGLAQRGTHLWPDLIVPPLILGRAGLRLEP